MGVLKGTIGYQKLYVLGALPEDVNERFLARIRGRGFKALTPEDEDDASVGWVPIERPLDDEIAFRAEGVFFGFYVNVAMRIDRWKFPAALVKSKRLEAERAYKQQHGKERLSKAEKTELHEMVEKKLRRDGEPVTLIADVSFDLDTGTLRLFSTSKLVTEHFYELFEKTFQLRCLPSGAFTTGVRHGVERRALDAAEPARL